MALADHRLQAAAGNCQSLVKRRLGDYPNALVDAQAALDHALSAPDLRLQAESLRNIGAVLQATGKFREALPAYERSLAAARTAADPLEEGKTLNDLGGLHRMQGHYMLALRHYEESLALRERVGDAKGRARVLGNICLAYQDLVDNDRALTYCRRAYDLAGELQDPALEGNTLNNLARVYRARQDLPEALSAFERSRDLKERVGDRAGVARAWTNIGELHWLLGDSKRALADFNQSLEIKELLGDGPGIAVTRFNIGVHLLEVDSTAEAMTQFHAALSAQSGSERPEVSWRVFNGLSRGYHQAGNDSLAILYGKKAVNEIQSIRGALTAIDEDLQRSFLGDKSQVYRRLANQLIDAGRIAEAQQVLDMMKQEDHFDFVRRDPGADRRTTETSLTRGEAELDSRYQELTRDIAAKGAEFALLKKKELDGAATPDEMSRLRRLDSELKESRAAFRTYLQQLANFFSQGDGRRAIEFGKKDLDSLDALRGTLGRLQHGAVLIHYLITENVLHIIVTGPNTNIPPVHRQAPVGRIALSRMISDYVGKLGSRGSDLLPEAKALYQVLLAPIRRDLDAYDARTLMVSLDGPLRYLPLAALHDGDGFLVQRYAMALYTAVAKDRLTDPPQRDLRVAGLGTTQAVEGFAALPAVSAELDGIIKNDDADMDGILPGKTFLDADFTVRNLERVLDAPVDGKRTYPIVHFASHFKFTPGTEEDSFLLMGGGAHLTLANLRDLSFDGVALLTLSACQTGVGGGADADGREIEGFGALAQAKGASAVLATLWPVADRSTAQLMVNFYRELRDGKQTKAEALQQAQLALLNNQQPGPAEGSDRGGTRLTFGAPAPEAAGIAAAGYAHPYFWAPFFLMGNWL
ncbi:MAG: CHAT domain-containing protein [Betaproteobacteria bacterium]